MAFVLGQVLFFFLFFPSFEQRSQVAYLTALSFVSIFNKSWRIHVKFSFWCIFAKSRALAFTSSVVRRTFFVVFSTWLALIFVKSGFFSRKKDVLFYLKLLWEYFSVVLFLQEGGTFLVSYFFRNVIFHKCIYFPKGACLSYLFWWNLRRLKRGVWVDFYVIFLHLVFFFPFLQEKMLCICYLWMHLFTYEKSVYFGDGLI